MIKYLLILASGLLVAACGTQPVAPSVGHIREEPRPAGNIPKPVGQTVVLPPPKAAAKTETYSVVVNNVPVRELLFALARDAMINVDIHPRIEGTVTLNALNQTLPQLLTRIAKQVDMRYEIDGQVLTVIPDSPYLKQYKIDYLNMTRESSGSVNISNQITSGGTGAAAISGSGGGVAGGAGGTSFSCGNRLSDVNKDSPGGGGGGAAGSSKNGSSNSISNSSSNCFWWTLVDNLRDILRETDKKITEGGSQGSGQNAAATQGTTEGNGQISIATPGGAQNIKNSGNTQSINASGGQNSGSGNQKSSTSAATARQEESARFRVLQAAQIIPNPEAGIIAIRATSKQHKQIQEFLDQILSSAKRQVLIEATIIEVQLSDQYQQGINWANLRITPNNASFNIAQGQVGAAPLLSGVAPGSSAGIFTLGYINPVTRFGNITATIQLLESFGKVKVISSPKISVLNNQTALLKVVDNSVYFTIGVTPATTTASGVVTPATYTSELHTVPVGFVINVTPQISSSDEITLNIRPTTSRIVGYVQDPNPVLKDSLVKNSIPVIQTREMESILKVASGQVAVMGGLMEDRIDNKKDGVPGLSQMPLIGDVFSYRDEKSTKTELVIFIRPVVIKEASLNADYKDFREFMPEQDFFTKPGPGDLKPLPLNLQETTAP
jgi:MSHA biogenesis protein MshL